MDGGSRGEVDKCWGVDALSGITLANFPGETQDILVLILSENCCKVLIQL